MSFLLEVTPADEEFWFWVCGLEAEENPRGDFIRDTRRLVRAGIDPNTRLPSALDTENAPIVRIYHELFLDYAEEVMIPSMEEENREQLVDTALYALCIASGEVFECGRHGEHKRGTNGVMAYSLDAYRDHVMGCIGVDVRQFDIWRLWFHQMIDFSLPRPLDEHVARA